MSRVYQKPEIRFELLTVSEFIAGSCTVDVGFGDVGAEKVCGMEDAGDILFSIMEGVSPCDVQPAEDGICYHGPTPNNSYFGS